jgi:hypothetical protein
MNLTRFTGLHVSDFCHHFWVEPWWCRISKKKAKVSELQMPKMKNPSIETAMKAISKQELAGHCRQKTRSVTNTTSMLENFFPFYWTPPTPWLSRFWRRMPWLFWTQNQDTSVPTRLNRSSASHEGWHNRKGNISLPVYRCGRRTTSLESFYSHIKNFIPGMCFSLGNL